MSLCLTPTICYIPFTILNVPISKLLFYTLDFTIFSLSVRCRSSALYIRAYMYACVYACVHVYIYVYIRVCVRVCMCMYACIYVNLIIGQRWDAWHSP